MNLPVNLNNSIDEIMNAIDEHFDYVLVSKIMKVLRWTWGLDNVEPSHVMLRDSIKDSIARMQKDSSGSSYSGGIIILNQVTCLSVIFTPEYYITGCMRTKVNDPTDIFKRALHKQLDILIHEIANNETLRLKLFEASNGFDDSRALELFYDLCKVAGIKLPNNKTQ